VSAPRAVATVTQLSSFDEIIDVRTPSEYAEDHVPGAVNRPVLSDDERARVGTIYNRVSAFNGKRVGAALIARNIAHHIETHFAERPKNWRPVVYCWRGGKRSDAMVHILREIGWDAHRLEGGYKAFRRSVLAELPELAKRVSFRVVCGLTGSGKSRLLATLRSFGAQVLDLEGLAAHRGSVLGNLPGAPQPSQRMFEGRIWHELNQLDLGLPVFVESESKRIGTLQVPDELMASLWSSACIRVEMDAIVRVELLKREYAHFLSDPAALGERLDLLTPLHGRTVVERWKQMGLNGDFDALVQELLERHYDPAYARSISAHYPELGTARSVHIAAYDDESFDAAAQSLIGIRATAGV
jgi:tRNA 2-selenouridine synthase